MDFLKTLLAYMALLTTLGVQEGPAPAAVRGMIAYERVNEEDNAL